MSREGIKTLIELALQDSARKYPNIPANAIPKPKYNPRTSNGLTKCIVDYVNLIGGMAERRNNTGRYIQPVTYKNIFGKDHVLQQGKYIKGTGKNGTSDVSGLYMSNPIAIEVKIGPDKMSGDQIAYKYNFEQAGGYHFIAKDFESFFVEFNKTFGI